MTSRDAIIGLINQYSFTLDQGDLRGFVNLFEHAHWSVEGQAGHYGSKQLYDNVISKIIIYEDGTPRTKHIATNIDLAINEDKNVASSQRYLMVLQQTRDLPLQVILSAHYFDEFEKVNGIWRFKSCIIKRPLKGDMTKHMQS